MFETEAEVLFQAFERKAVDEPTFWKRWVALQKRHGLQALRPGPRGVPMATTWAEVLRACLADIRKELDYAHIVL